MKKKKILISVISLVLVIALGAGVWFGVRNRNSDPVFVYDFSNIGMTEYWGDTQNSYGPVSSDNIQTVFLSDTQKVTEVLVKEGDTVKEGDLLMRFDTTLSDLELERKRLEVEKLKLQLEDEKRELGRINSMKPMVVPPPTEAPEVEEDLGSALPGEFKLYGNRAHDGSSPEKAIVCWLRSDASVNGALMEKILKQAGQLQSLAAGASHASAPLDEDYGDIFDTENPPEPPETDPPETDPPETDPSGTEPSGTEPSGTEPPETEPAEPVEVSSCYVVFKITSGNMSLGQRQVWQGMKLHRGSDGYSFRFFDAMSVPDYTMEADSSDSFEDAGPEIDLGSGYTAAQIAQMRAEQQKKIKKAEFDIKMAEANYKIMLTEVNDGNIHAQFDGVVISLLPEEEARQNRQPMMKVSGGGGFYIEGSVSELTREDMVIGQQVEINDWNTGMFYTGEVVSVGEFPSEDWGGGGGNPNVTYYPFQVFVDESADLQTGSYVSLTYSAGTSENGVYLEKPFLRTENGRSYVYVMGEDQRLEKRYVTTGKSLWGSYIEVTGGLTAEDMIAFPYGKNVKPGAKTQPGDMSDLYGF